MSGQQSSPGLIIPSAVRTKQALLAVAERLFGAKGIHQSSIRQITTEAGTSPDAVNYHFGSKKGLVSAVLENRTSQLSDSVDAILAERALGRPPTAAGVARATVLPAIEMASQESGRHYHAFLVSLLADRSLAAELLRPEASPQFCSLLKALGEARPELTEGQRSQRLTLALNVVLHAVGSMTVAAWLSDALKHDGDDLTTLLLTTVTAILSS
jgi:AcrR family transcriptional regulator